MTTAWSARCWLLAAVVVAAFAAGCRGEKTEGNMTADRAPRVVTHCFGRFCVDVPVEARRAGEAYKLQDLEVAERVLTGPRDTALAALYGEIDQAIAEQVKDRSLPGDRGGEVTGKVEVAPDFRVVTFIYQVPSVHNAIGMRALADTALKLEATYSVEYEDRIVGDLRKLGTAYRARAKDEVWPLPGKDLFYLRHGLLQLDGQEQEDAMVRFEDGPLDGTLSLHTETTDEPKKKGLGQRFMEAVGLAGPSYAAGISPVKHRKRTVAGMDGEEMILRDVENGQLSYMWMFPGEANDPHKPQLKFAYDTSDGKPKETTALWDAVLDSVRLAKGK